MNEYSYFTFSLNHSVGYISTGYVAEVFALPELIPIADTHPDIVGVVNLRGEILPVMDLNLTWGEEVSDYHLTDSVIVLMWENLRVGIIANEVYGVKSVASETITTELTGDRQQVVIEEKKIIDSVIRRSGDILILNNPENWSRTIQTHELQNSSNQDRTNPNYTPEERAIFKARADSLKLSEETQDLKAFRPIAVVGLKNNYFGIDLGRVREFTDINQLTPIPCCPPPIIGNMNLRGEIITLVDIRGLLNLQLTPILDGSKAMIVEVEDIVAGILVEAVYEAMFLLNPLEIIPVSVGDYLINNEYLEGAAPYQETMMNMLDLPKILLTGGLIVDEVI